mgnify:CR=1 FL=1
MDRGISTRTVWPIAAEEAIAGKFESIEPSHIFNAVLKMAEIEQRVLASIANDRHSKKLFKKERDSSHVETA